MDDAQDHDGLTPEQFEQQKALKGADLLNPDAFEDGERQSMGDRGVVGALVRAMVGEAARIRAAYHATEDGAKASSEAQAAIQALVERNVARFDPSNAAFAQTWDREGQAVWLRRHGYGTADQADDLAPLRALLATTLKRVGDATIALEGEQIDDEEARFRIEAAIEDCVSMLLGVENSGDENG